MANEKFGISDNFFSIKSKDGLNSKDRLNSKDKLYSNDKLYFNDKELTVSLSSSTKN